MTELLINDRITSLEQRIESLEERVRVVDNEKLALEVILLATAATLSSPYVERIKNYIDSMISTLEISGVNENPEHTAIRHAVYKRVFSRANLCD